MKLSSTVISIFIIIFACIFMAPVVITIFLSCTDGLSPYVDFFVWEPTYLYALTNSIIVSFTTSFATILISILAAYVFAKVKFRGCSILFFLYIMILIMPFQVTLLPQYIVSKKIGIYDTLGALILPGIFSPFAPILLTQMMKFVPNEVIEAARLETNSTLCIITQIIVPFIRPGIICTWILSFSETWNAVAEPRFLMESLGKMPLMYHLGNLTEVGFFEFAAVVISMLLPYLLFTIFESEIVENIGMAKLK